MTREADERAWETGFRLVKQWIEDNDGDALVPGGAVVDGYPLGRWVATQRAHKRSSSGRTLRADRALRLERIGFVWGVKRSIDATVTDALAALAAGHQPTVAQATALRAASRVPGRLTPDQVSRLAAAGFSFRLRDARWDAAIGRVRAYQDAHDGRLPHRRARQGTFHIGRWWHAALDSLAAGDLPAERAAQVAELAAGKKAPTTPES